jgi:hypothetical protein
MAFKPKKKLDFAMQIEKYLLDGYIIRYDCRDDQPIEVIGREHIKNLAHMGNIGQESRCNPINIYCAHGILHTVADKLGKEFSVRKVSCEYSGCCQYSTYGYYIDGD